MWSYILSYHTDSDISWDFPADIAENFPCVGDFNQ